jgi:hypothetical protein
MRSINYNKRRKQRSKIVVIDRKGWIDMKGSQKYLLCCAIDFYGHNEFHKCVCLQELMDDETKLKYKNILEIIEK